MTLLVRDEIDIVRDNIEFHLNHGVDFVVATDNGSLDGTRDVLAEYERLGLLHLLDEPVHDYSQGQWVTRMAALARDRFGADWILNNDADEFWYPVSGDLKTGLEDEVANVLVCSRRNMLFPRDRPRRYSWSADLVYYVTNPSPPPRLADYLTSPLPEPYFCFDLQPKALCRARGLISVAQGNHSAEYEVASSAPSQNILVYHFPVRSLEHFSQQVELGGSAYARNTTVDPSMGWHRRRWYAKLREGDLEGAFREALPSDESLQGGLQTGEVAVDHRMRDAFEGRFVRCCREPTEGKPGMEAEELRPAPARALSDALARSMDFSSLIYLGRRPGTFLSAIEGHGRCVTGVGVRHGASGAGTAEAGPNVVFRDLRLPFFVGRSEVVVCFGLGGTEGKYRDVLVDTVSRAAGRHVVLAGFPDINRQDLPSHDCEAQVSWSARFANRGLGIDGPLTSGLQSAFDEALAQNDQPSEPVVVLTRR